MKKNFVLTMVALSLFLFSCGPTNKPLSAKVDAPKAATALATLIPISTIAPTVTPSPTAIPEAQQKIRAIMVAYGKVDEKYLAEAYWTKMAADIAQYGPAKRILTLEFHGDNYSMYGGGYSMTPGSFFAQMDYLMANNYHFVTGPETLGFLEGWLQLPARSVILTTDSGAASLHSMPRIIGDFRILEAKYGYTPHMQSYIWTQGMSAAEGEQCKNDVCWLAFQTYRDSGYFTFGSHTESHGDFSTFTVARTQTDLTTNMAKIKANLGLNIYSLTWPFEACSTHEQTIRDLGIKFAFGGWSRDMVQLYTYQSDSSPLCLPRLFPPNPEGTSGRPDGKTLPQMLDTAMNQYAPIP